MQPHIQETAVIRPIKPPFDADHVLSLSHLDTDRNLLLTLRYLRIYSNSPHQHSDPFHVITTALSAALPLYYPFAGTLRRRSSDHRLELHCRVGDGLPVVNATASCPLSAVDTDTITPFVEQLVPDPDTNEDPIRPMILQITKFSCGGFVLGAAVHHAICDGFGATQFFNGVAELARGSDRVVGVDPVWDRSELLGPRNPPRVEYPMQEVLSLDKGFSAYAGSGKRVVREYLNVEEEWLDRVKGVLYKQSGLKCTTFEALGASIWSARIRAGKGSAEAEEKITFAYSMSIRNIVDPPLPPGYWGNSCVPVLVHLTAEEVAEQPVWKTAAAIKKSKQKVSAEYVASFIDFQELHYEEGISGGRRVTGFTDWRHLGHSTVDFGWGGPTAVVPLSTRLLGSVEPCFLLAGKEGEVKVVVHLEEDVVLAFREEMEKLRSLEYGLLSAI